MKLLIYKKSFWMLLSLTLFFTACQKNVKDLEDPIVAGNKSGQTPENQRAFKASFSTWYRFSPLQVPLPVQVAGTDYLGVLNIPGGGEGNTTHLGKTNVYFNQLGYVTPPDFQNPVGTLAAPVTAIIQYPVLGAPLPLIQQGDFTGLSALITSWGLQAQINGQYISTVIFNDKGEALFISVISQNSVVVEEGVGHITGTSMILGGTGKYANATGEVAHSISFNLSDPNKASYTLDGWIKY